MEGLRHIKHMIERELEEYGSMSEVPTGSLDALQKMTDIVKNILKIEMLYDGDADESREPGTGYSSRRRHYVRGHYSREGGHDGARTHYSYAEGRDEVHRMLKDAMSSADNDRHRDVIRKCIEEIERM